jgi:signal transduction histidine kinase
MYARYLATRGKAWIWHGGVGFTLLVYVFGREIGLAETLPFHLLYAFLLSLLSLYPIFLLSGICRGNPHPLLYLFTGAAAVQLALMVYDYLGACTALPQLSLRAFSGLLYLTVAGLLLSQEAYLQGSGWQGLHIRVGEQQKRLRRAHSRLIQTENTVMLQDRLIVTGILAAGAVHEFKNTLSQIHTGAAFAARRNQDGEVQQALDLIVEQANSGQKAVTEILDQLLARGREEVGTVHLKSDLELLLRMIRTGCRREGIQLVLEIPDHVRLRVRRGELEQVLVNLARNAMDSVRSLSEDTERKICIRAYLYEGQVIIEVNDTGAGIPPQLQSRIFEISVSGKESTGLGLFVAKTLVERNAGKLEIIPSDRGGYFRMALPSA